MLRTQREKTEAFVVQGYSSPVIQVSHVHRRVLEPTDLAPYSRSSPRDLHEAFLAALGTAPSGFEGDMAEIRIHSMHAPARMPPTMYGIHPENATTA